MLAMFLVYLASNVQGIIDLLRVVTGISITFLGAWFLFYIIDSGVSVVSPFKHKFAKIALWVCISSSVLGTLLPKEKTVYMMAAAYMGQTVIQSDTGKKIGKIVEKKLESYLEELDNKVQSTSTVQ